MLLENFALYKDLAKYFEKSYSIYKDFFESSLKKEDHFYPTRLISWEQVRLDQDIKDKEVVSLVDCPSHFLETNVFVTSTC